MKKVLTAALFLVSSLAFAAESSADNPEKVMNQLQTTLSARDALLMPPAGREYFANELSVVFERIDMYPEDDLNAEGQAIVYREIRAMIRDSGALAPGFDGEFTVRTNSEAESFFMDQLVAPNLRERVRDIVNRLQHYRFYRIGEHDIGAEVVGRETIVLISGTAVLIIRMMYVHA